MLNISDFFFIFLLNNLHSQSLDIPVAEEGAEAEVEVVAEEVEQ